ncbi:MAG: acetate--CoA ligase [Bdellovibrionaceae bacterium]|nr:acetate--CoA ligase [Pseudobdellovibrionaceae bacterium]
MESKSIDTVLKETRSFEPPASFAQHANLTTANYDRLWKDSQEQPVRFWEQAAKNIHWFETWTETLSWDEPFAKWFVGGKTNASFNCLDRHVAGGRKDKTAILWEGEEGDVRTLTYGQLLDRVSQLANGMQNDLGLKPGDTVAIYMPMIPEAVVTMLACARVGVTHSVIFAGFSSSAIRDRVLDADCKAVFTADYGRRRGKKLELQPIVEEGLKGVDCVQHVVVFRNDKNSSLGSKGIEWQALVDRQDKKHEALKLDAEHPLYFLYTSGTTGKPKGIVHSTGGYMVGATQTAKWVFDLKEDDIYWCTADIGWVTGHSYVVYGILSNGATALMYEGAPNYPDWGRFWEIIDKHKVTILYTAPTAIRAFMRAGETIPRKYKLDSLRLLGTVGEPINPEAWIWYHKEIGHEKCPIVDTWWQTETGAIMISPLPGVTATKPGSATRPFPGIVADIVDENGKSCAPNEGGYLVIRHPWPSMVRTIHKNPDRFKEQYWARFPGLYFAGDGAHKDENGYFWIKGRVDDVINVSGHRLGTMEIESALVSHPAVAEAAVVGRPDELKGQAITAFVIPKESADLSDLASLTKELCQHVVSEIGALARPEEIKFTRTLPKTRSGKIMRRLLKDLAAGKQASGDTTTLENPDLVQLIQ